jgi:hypothetical protein
MNHMSILRNRLFIISILIMVTATISISIIILQNENKKIVETFDFFENHHIISKNNQINTNNGGYVTPNDEVEILFNIKNLHNHSVFVNPLLSISVDGKKIENQTLDSFEIEGAENISIKRLFDIGSDGLNQVEFILNILNSTTKQSLYNATALANFEVMSFSEKSQNDSIFLATSALLVTAALGTIAVFFSYLGHKTSFQEQRYTTTTKVFELLSGEENKERWKKLHQWYHESKEKGKSATLKDEDKKLDATRMKEALNQAGALYNAGLIDRKLLLDIYGGIIIRLYKVLENDIEDDQKTNPEASKFTKIMYDDACNYWRKHYGLPLPEPFPKNNYPW